MLLKQAMLARSHSDFLPRRPGGRSALSTPVPPTPCSDQHRGDPCPGAQLRLRDHTHVVRRVQRPRPGDRAAGTAPSSSGRCSHRRAAAGWRAFGLRGWRSWYKWNGYLVIALLVGHAIFQTLGYQLGDGKVMNAAQFTRHFHHQLDDCWRPSSRLVCSSKWLSLDHHRGATPRLRDLQAIHPCAYLAVEIASELSASRDRSTRGKPGFHLVLRFLDGGWPRRSFFFG